MQCNAQPHLLLRGQMKARLLVLVIVFGLVSVPALANCADLVTFADLPPRTSPPSKLDLGPFQVHSTG